MEERSQVRELDRDRGRHDPLVAAVAETGGQQHEHGPEPLAAGFHHVPGNFGEHLVPAERGISQGCLHRGQIRGHFRGQARVSEFDSRSDGHSSSMSSARSSARLRQPRNTPAYETRGVRGRPGQDRDRCRRMGSAAATFTSGIQRTNNWVAAWLARLSNGWGTMPRTIVASMPSPTAEPVSRPGTTTSGPSGTGSLKYMSTMMRT